MNLIGGNGQGFFQNIDSQSKGWLYECFENRPFCVNFPGGAEANIATPNQLLKGWGLTETEISARFSQGQTDEDGNGYDKWMEKLSQQNLFPNSFISDLATLSEDFPQMEVIWKANLFCSLEATKTSFTAAYNVANIRKCVLGNEVYSKGNFNFDFDAFLVKAEPFIVWLKGVYPEIKIGIPFAPNLSRADHMKWNGKLIAYLEQGIVDAVDVHIYLTEEDFPTAFAEYPIQKIDVEKYGSYPQLEDCFSDFGYEYTHSDKFETVLSFIESNTNAKIWMTEFNTKPSNYFGNTLSNAAFIFSSFMRYSSRLEVMCVHNLVAPDVYGCISRTSELDLTYSTDKNARRTGYYALRLASEALSLGEAIQIKDAITVSESIVGWVDNLSEYNPIIAISIDPNRVIKEINYVSLAGINGYDSLGKAGYMSKTTEPFQSNVYFTEGSQSDFFDIGLQLEFAYFHFITAEKKKKRRLWWQFWKPKTIINDKGVV